MSPPEPHRSPGIRLGQRIDRLPGALTGMVGVAGGLLAGLWVASMTPWIGGPFFVLFVGLGLYIAYRGEAVSVVTQVEQPAREESVLEDEAAEPDDQKTEDIDPLAMVPIPEGRFLMGSPDDDEFANHDEQPAHEVHVSGFSCMVYPVTRLLYETVMEGDPGWPSGPDVDRLPANMVSWYDAVEFCNRLSTRNGFNRCYAIEGKNVTWRRSANGYRLPTEAEWEYACRAGTNTRWWFGDDETLILDYAWIDENSRVKDEDTGDTETQPQPVGTKPENPWGLHDMHGNVFEWCWDWYSPYETSGSDTPLRNPLGPSDEDAPKVVDEQPAKLLRGGGFDDGAGGSRCAGRYWYRFGPRYRVRFIGFRCVRDSGCQR